MSEAPSERVLRVIQRLLAKESSLRTIGSEAALNEAESAAAKIAELMLRHRIESSQLEMETETAKRSPLGRETYAYDGTERYRATRRQAWEVQLATTVARAHLCRILVGHGYFVFLGEEQDRAIAMAMFRVLRRELTLNCDYSYHRARAFGYQTRGFISSFFVGAVTRIARRYHDMKTGVLFDTGATALVRQIDASLDQYVHQETNGSRPVTTTPRGSRNELGLQEGRALGDRVSLDTRGVDPAGQPRGRIEGP